MTHEAKHSPLDDGTLQFGFLPSVELAEEYLRVAKDFPGMDVQVFSLQGEQLEQGLGKLANVPEVRRPTLSADQIEKYNEEGKAILYIKAPSPHVKSAFMLAMKPIREDFAAKAIAQRRGINSIFTNPPTREP